MNTRHYLLPTPTLEAHDYWVADQTFTQFGVLDTRLSRRVMSAILVVARDAITALDEAVHLELMGDTGGRNSLSSPIESWEQLMADLFRTPISFADPPGLCNVPLPDVISEPDAHTIRRLVGAAGAFLTAESLVLEEWVELGQSTANASQVQHAQSLLARVADGASQMLDLAERRTVQQGDLDTPTWVAGPAHVAHGAAHSRPLTVLVGPARSGIRATSLHLLARVLVDPDVESLAPHVPALLSAVRSASARRGDDSCDVEMMFESSEHLRQIASAGSLVGRLVLSCGLCPSVAPHVNDAWPTGSCPSVGSDLLASISEAVASATSGHLIVVSDSLTSCSIPDIYTTAPDLVLYDLDLRGVMPALSGWDVTYAGLDSSHESDVERRADYLRAVCLAAGARSFEVILGSDRLTRTHGRYGDHPGEVDPRQFLPSEHPNSRSPDLRHFLLPVARRYAGFRELPIEWAFDIASEAVTRSLHEWQDNDLAGGGLRLASVCKVMSDIANEKVRHQPPRSHTADLDGVPNTRTKSTGRSAVESPELRAVTRTYRTLSDRDRSILDLSITGLPASEVAGQLELSVSNVITKVRRIRRQLTQFAGPDLITELDLQSGRNEHGGAR